MSATAFILKRTSTSEEADKLTSFSIDQLTTLVEAISEDVIRWRRHLHEYPELSFQEEQTSQFVFDTLSTFPNLELSRPTKTSVMARLVGDKPGRTLAIRADMDALPITEENTFEFASKNPGVMHACGHDGHTAMLLGTAKILSNLTEYLSGEIRFIFQHAEELHPGGAVEMVEAGVMEGVDLIIGIHLRSLIEVGKVGVAAGPINAASDRWDITIFGKGGHAAAPHSTVDSVVVAGEVISNLQHIVSRNKDPLDPLVLSVTKITGGTAYNVIPGTVEMSGTVRTYNPELRERVPEMMERVIKGVTEAHGATYAFDYRKGYRPLINDETVSRMVREGLLEVFGEDAVYTSKPGMGGEDFSGFLQVVPGTFFHVGAGNVEKNIVYPHHHPKFTVDEDSLPIGVKAFVHLALKLTDSTFVSGR
jgi:amidohydrolase